jgi:hypothetical protein
MKKWVSCLLIQFNNLLIFILGVKETDTGLAPPNLWDLAADRQRMQQEQPLQVI